MVITYSNKVKIIISVPLAVTLLHVYISINNFTQPYPCKAAPKTNFKNQKVYILTQWTISFNTFGDHGGNSWQLCTRGMAATYYHLGNESPYHHPAEPHIPTLPTPCVIRQQVSFCSLSHSLHHTLKIVLGAAVHFINITSE